MDVFSRRGNHHLWTYSIVLGSFDFHPSLEDFEREAIRRAIDDGKGKTGDLTAKVRLR